MCVTVKVGAIKQTANSLTSFWIMLTMDNRSKTSNENYHKHKNIRIIKQKNRF